MGLVLHDMSRKFFATHQGKVEGSEVVVNGKEAVGGVAAVVSGLIGDNEYLEAQLIEWLTTTSNSYATQTLESRRALILVLSAKEGKLQV